MKRNRALFELFVNLKAKLNVMDAEARSPLHYAVLENNPKIVKELLSRGAKHELPDTAGKTPLQHAREKGFQEIVALLEKQEAKSRPQADPVLSSSASPASPPSPSPIPKKKEGRRATFMGLPGFGSGNSGRS